MIKVRKASKEEAQEFEATFTQNGTLPNGLKPLHTNVLSSSTTGTPREVFGSPGTEVRRREGDTDRLGTPSADSSRISPRIRQGPSFGRYSPVSYRPDVTRKNSQGEASWKTNSGDRSRNASISSSSSHMYNSIDKAPAVPAIDQEVTRTSSRSVSDTPPTIQAPPSSRSLQQLHAEEPPISTPNKMRGSLSPAHTSMLLSTPPPPPPMTGDESNEEYWAELRNYIEVQTEAIVHSIQALLSSIREGAQGNQLHENLTQITTIVSSIIAISKDNIPRAAAAAASAASGGEASSQAASEAASADGERILQELSDHCEKLIEMQAIGGQFDKSTKSNMASASYGVAKGLKALNGLLNIE